MTRVQPVEPGAETHETLTTAPLLITDNAQVTIMGGLECSHVPGDAGQVFGDDSCLVVTTAGGEWSQTDPDLTTGALDSVGDADLVTVVGHC